MEIMELSNYYTRVGNSRRSMNTYYKVSSGTKFDLERLTLFSFFDRCEKKKIVKREDMYFAFAVLEKYFYRKPREIPLWSLRKLEL